MTAPVLTDPGPERARGPRSRTLLTCPNSPTAPPAPDTARRALSFALAAILTSLSTGLRALWARSRRDDRGMSTVEYAIGTLAAAAFAAVLYTVVSGDSIVTALTGLVERALQVTF
jgi:hypothetical protein